MAGDRRSPSAGLGAGPVTCEFEKEENVANPDPAGRSAWAPSPPREGYVEACIFCRIIARRLPARWVFEDEEIVAFEDAHPQAPVHTLIVPRRHIASLQEATPADAALLGRLFLVASQLAGQRGLDAQGYRTVVNTGAGAGQSVFHLHLHLLGGRAFRWPPG